jgi:nucleoside-diphosphate-sugar epimerase
VLAALDRGKVGRTYHFAGPMPVSMRTLAETFARALRVAAPVVRVPEVAVRAAVRGLGPIAGLARQSLPLDQGDIDFFTHDTKISTARARRELAWEPQVDLEVGAARAVRWYEDRGLL